MYVESNSLVRANTELATYGIADIDSFPVR